jgi:hypothetical protein
VYGWSARAARAGEPDVVYGYEAYTDENAFRAHITNPAVQKFGEVMDDLVEGWTMLVPFCVSSRNFATTPPVGPEDGCYVSGPGC